MRWNYKCPLFFCMYNSTYRLYGVFFDVEKITWKPQKCVLWGLLCWNIIILWSGVRTAAKRRNNTGLHKTIMQSLPVSTIKITHISNHLFWPCYIRLYIRIRAKSIYKVVGKRYNINAFALFCFVCIMFTWQGFRMYKEQGNIFIKKTGK